MSKQLRTWLFVLLGTLLTSTSLLAEGVITMTTNKGVGEKILLSIEANGNVTIDGIKEDSHLGLGYYTLTNQTITIRGDVTELDCRYNQLTSLNLSGCTALTELSCWDNQLISLDVSSCTSLTTLDCRDNQLTSLDVSGCTALTTLYCYNNQLTSLDLSERATLTQLGCKENPLASINLSNCKSLKEFSWDGNWENKLTSLDVSGCTALTKLDCNRNQLTSLDVSGCTSLTNLSCIENQLTSLDVSNCTALTQLDCGGNQLTSLNVSGCTSLTTLNCGRNQLNSLDLSGSVALKELYCSGDYSTKGTLTRLNVSGCTSLTKLECQNNQLTSLDASGCTALKTLSITYQNLSTLSLSGCTSLTELECQNNQLSSLDVSGCSSLTKLSCFSNQLTSLDLSSCTALTELDCGYNQLTSLDASGCTSLTKLDCSDNRLTSLDVSGCTALTKLSCGGNRLTSLNLSDCVTLKELYCSGDYSTKGTLTRLNVSGCTSLRTLECSYNQLTSLEASGCTSLTKLECWHNKLTSLNLSGCIALTELNIFTFNNQLTSINLSNCKSLEEFSCTDAKLTNLDVSGCTALTKLLCYNNQLTSLDLSGCTALTELNCSKNQLTSLDVSRNTALTELNCSSNQLISLHLSSCRALTKVDCSSNQLTSLDLSDHKDLTTLSCSDNLLRKIDLSNCPSIVSLTCDINQIKESEMTNLVNSLPDLQGKEVGYFRVFNETSEHEGNVCLSDHVATAKAKNWKTQFKRDYYGDIWYDYTGADKPTFAVTNESTRGGIVAITGASNLNSVVKGTELTVVATPAEGYKLTALTANGVDILATKRFVVMEATVVKATFELITYSVKTSKLGEGTLNVSGADDLDAVMPDTELTIEATPAEGYELTALTANDEDILTSKKVVVNEDLIIKATFEKKTFAVTLAKDGEGDLNATGADDLNAVPYGTKLTITAIPAEGYELKALMADGLDILSTKSVEVTNNTRITAIFKKKTFAVSLIKDGEGTLSVKELVDLQAVPYSTELTINATPAMGYELVSITAGGTDITASKKVIVTGNLTVKATFAKKNFAVSLTKEGEGTISATGASDLNAVAYGTELTINATPAEGYELTALTANGTDILATKKIVVKDNLTVKATFEKKTFAVTLTSNEHGDITIVEPVNLEAVSYGTTLTVKATGKNAQCELTALTANGKDILATQSFVVTGATEVKATFVDHTGVETTVTQQVKLYPNPATDYVIVEGVAPASEVTLHSMTGERLYAGRADDRGTLQIDLTPYADGVYLVCVAGKTYRVVVRH